MAYVTSDSSNNSPSNNRSVTEEPAYEFQNFLAWKKAILSCDIPFVLDTIRWYRKYSRNTTN